MNRVVKLIGIAMLAAFACASLAAQSASQPLGDYARAVKKNKSAPAAPAQKKVYDNDTLPTTGPVSVVGNRAGESASTDQAGANDAANSTPDAKATAAADNKEDKAKKDEAQIKPGQSLEERKQAVDAWKQKVDSQNDKVTKLAHELDLLQREYRVKSAEFYANTANRAQNPKGFSQDDADYKQQIAEKQKALDAEKAKLSDIQEQARRAGVPGSAVDPN